MTIYLIRHGETVENSRGIQQGPNAKLSPLGREQAQKLASRFISLSVDLILSSPLERTRQTAEIIAKTINKTVEYSSLFREHKRPSEIENKLWNDPEVLKIKELIKLHDSDPNWRYSDEETFLEFRERGLKILEYIQNLDKENILLVTHGSVLIILAAVMLHGRDVTIDEYIKLLNFLNLSNTGITICEYAEKQWRLVTWNDRSHLG